MQASFLAPLALTYEHQFANQPHDGARRRRSPEPACRTERKGKALRLRLGRRLDRMCYDRIAPRGVDRTAYGMSMLTFCGSTEGSQLRSRFTCREP